MYSIVINAISPFPFLSLIWRQYSLRFFVLFPCPRDVAQYGMEYLRYHYGVRAR